MRLPPGRPAAAQHRDGGVPEWLKGADCKSVGDAYAGSNPASSTINGKPREAGRTRRPLFKPG